jgi:Ras-related protein Rab-11A
MSDSDYDYVYKVVLIGDAGVGKSNILSRFIKDKFFAESKATVGVEFESKNFEIEGDRIKVQMWDTAGQERYKSITTSYYKGAKGAMLVFDLTKRKSFESIDRWIPDLRSKGDPNITILLIGNKCDLEELREVSQEEAQSKAQTHSKILLILDIAYVETSALKSINIEYGFNIMINGIIKNKFLEIYKTTKKFENEDDDEEDNKKDGIDITNTGEVKKQKKNCC